MASEIEICNLALGNIRAGSINSFTEGSIQAQQCNLKYSIIRDRCLREIVWSFNRKIEALATLSSVTIFNWAYAYQYPSDCLKIRRLIDTHEETSTDSTGNISRTRNLDELPLRHERAQIPYEVFNVSNNKVIGANQDQLRIEYAAKVEDPNLFSDDFILAMSHLLGAELAIPIVGAEIGRALRRDSLQMYQSYMNDAISDDMNEQYHEPLESDFVTIRN